MLVIGYLKRLDLAVWGVGWSSRLLLAQLVGHDSQMG